MSGITYGSVASSGKSVTHRLLDSIFMPEYDYARRPGFVGATDSLVFKQKTIDTDQVTVQQYAGPGYLEGIPLEGDYPNLSAMLGNAKVLPVNKFAGRLPISEDFRKDDLTDFTVTAIRDMGTSARLTEDKEAFSIFQNATSTNPLYTTGDGLPLLSDSHISLSGQVVDNYTTSAAATGVAPTAAEMAAAIELMFNALQSQPRQNGQVGGFEPETLLVPPAMFAAATVATNTQQTLGSNNNDINYISSTYPGLRVVSSTFLSTANGGNDARMFLLSRSHSITRYVREPVTTRFVDVAYNEVSDHSFYLTSFKHLVVAPSYEGVVGHIFT